MADRGLRRSSATAASRPAALHGHAAERIRRLGRRALPATAMLGLVLFAATTSAQLSSHAPPQYERGRVPNGGARVQGPVSGGFTERGFPQTSNPAANLAVQDQVNGLQGAGPAAGAELQLQQTIDVERMLSPSGMTSTLKIMLLLTVLSLAPSILIMTTCFIRFVIVMGLLRQALGTQQLPPNQVIISLCLFLTLMVMAPVWQQAYDQGIRPYTNAQPGERPPTLEEAFANTVQPLRQFMSEQINKADNGDAVWMFLEFRNGTPNQAPPDSYDDVPLTVLLPAYMLSELKTAFIIGFQIYLPFLVIDMVVSSVLISMGMMMLPPVLISLPFKLLLFVLIDGWFLTVGMLLESVRPFG